MTSSREIHEIYQAKVKKSTYETVTEVYRHSEDEEVVEIPADEAGGIDRPPCAPPRDADTIRRETLRRLRLERYLMKKKLKLEMKNEKLLSKLLMIQMLTEENLRKKANREAKVRARPLERKLSLLKLRVNRGSDCTEPKRKLRILLKLKKRVNLESLELKLMSKLLKLNSPGSIKIVMPNNKRGVVADVAVNSA